MFAKTVPKKLDKKVFALTIVYNGKRSGLNEDGHLIYSVLQDLHRLGFESGYLGWEIQTDPKQRACLHLHTTIVGKTTPYMKKLMAPHKFINCKIEKLEFQDDLDKWTNYCQKNKWRDIFSWYDGTNPVGPI